MADDELACNMADVLRETRRALVTVAKDLGTIEEAEVIDRLVRAVSSIALVEGTIRDPGLANLKAQIDPPKVIDLHRLLALKH